MAEKPVKSCKLSSEHLYRSYRETCMGGASHRWRELFACQPKNKYGKLIRKNSYCSHYGNPFIFLLGIPLAIFKKKESKFRKKKRRQLTETRSYKTLQVYLQNGKNISLYYIGAYDFIASHIFYNNLF